MELNGQTAMLERFAKKHGFNLFCAKRDRSMPMDAKGALVAFGRELLQAVQERDAKLCLRSRACPNYHGCHKQDELAIRSQTYADLFPEEKE